MNTDQQTDPATFEQDPGSGPYRYWAYLSYSHHDQGWARWLLKSIETFHGHKRLVGTKRGGVEVPAHLSVFRDRDDLAGAADLSASLREALRASRFLIVICSPAAARSPYVDQEIRTFKSLGRQQKILALIVDGEPHAAESAAPRGDECFPEALKFASDTEGRLGTQRTEPLAADVRPGKDGKRNALLKIVAGILGITFDELRQRNRERRIRLLAVTAAGALAGLVVLGILAVAALHARGRAAEAGAAEREARVSSEARDLVIQSESQLGQDRIDLALLLGIEAHHRRGRLESYQPLLRALEHEPRLRGLLHGHQGTVSTLAFSPDGDRMLSGDKDGDVWSWKVDLSEPTGQRLYRLPSAIKALAFAHGGARLLSVDDHAIQLRDAGTGQQRAPPLQGHPESILTVALSPDGAKAALAGRFHVSLWSLRDWRQLGPSFITHDTIISGLVFTSNGEKLLTAGESGDLQLWDVKTRRVVSRSHVDPGVLEAAVSSDGASFATGARRVTLWNSETLKVREQSERGESNMTGLAFAPDRPWLASANLDGKARLWNLDRSAPIEPALPHGSPVVSVAFGRHGRLATGTQTGTVHLWDLDARRRLPSEVSGPASVRAVTLGPGSRLILGMDGGSVSSYDLEARRFVGEAVRVFERDDDPFRLVLDPGGGRLAIAGTSTVTLWDLQTGKRAFTLRHDVEKRHVPAVVFNADASQLATGGVNGLIQLWNLQDGSPIGPALLGHDGHDGSVLSLAFDGQSATLASGGGDGAIRLWDTKSRQPRGKPLLGHRHPVVAVAFSAAGELVSVDESGEIRFWDMNGGRSTEAFGGEAASCVVAASFSANRRWLASARQCMKDWSLGAGATVRIWDLQSRESLELESKGLVLPLPAWGELSIDADGRRVALASGQTVLVWDMLPALWEARACRIANRNLTVAEWNIYMSASSSHPYQCTCPGLPSGETPSKACPSAR